MEEVAMTDEPGLPATDERDIRRLARLVEALDLTSADVKALLREIEASAPGSIGRMATHLRLRRLGLSTSTAH